MLAAGVQEVHRRVGPETADGPSGDLLAHLHGGGEILLVDLEHVVGVRAGDHEGVATGRRVDVHEGDHAIVLIDLRGGNRPGHDGAEDAVVRHGLRLPGPAGGATRYFFFVVVVFAGVGSGTNVAL